MGSVLGPIYTNAQLRALWVQYGGNPQAAATAAAIAQAESGGGANSINRNTNGSTDRGLWQINSVHGTQSTFDVAGNTRAAIAISNNGSNWSPWTTFTSGAYTKYLNGAAGGNSSGGVSNGVTATPTSWVGDLTGITAIQNEALHIAAVVLNWTAYIAFVVMGGGLMLVGVVMLVREAPGAKPAISAVKSAAKVLPLL